MLTLEVSREFWLQSRIVLVRITDNKLGSNNSFVKNILYLLLFSAKIRGPHIRD